MQNSINLSVKGVSSAVRNLGFEQRIEIGLESGSGQDSGFWLVKYFELDNNFLSDHFSMGIMLFLQRNARPYAEQLCLSMSSVVCLSVTFRYRDHIGWHTLRIIFRLNTEQRMVFVRPDPNMDKLVQSASTLSYFFYMF